jgi:hypothetical protein
MRSKPDSDLDPEILKALGTLVVRHSALEEALRDALWLETKTDKIIVHVLMSGLSCSTLIDKFGAVFYEHHSEHRESIGKLCAHLTALNDKRNALIHSFWTTSVGAEHMMRIKVSAKPKTGLVSSGEGVPASKVFELARELEDAENKVWEVITDLSIPS